MKTCLFRNTECYPLFCRKRPCRKMKSMPSSRILTTSLMLTFLASSSALRPRLRPSFCDVMRFARARSTSKRTHPLHRQLGHQLPLHMLLGVDASAGIVGLGAISALRLLTSSITPKRVRVMTDIDDTVKSSGNKRLMGIPLGGIDAQC